MLTITSKPNVLIVEDEGIIARDIEMQLAEFGCTVVDKASTAEEALEKIELYGPDLVLMDIRIQGSMDGIAAAEVIHKRFSIPVIYLTAHADQSTLERAKSTNPIGYIVKPLGNSSLEPVITMGLNNYRVQKELENHRKMLSTILQGLPDAVLVTDPNGEVLLLNQAAEGLTGWTQAEAAGKNIAEVAPIEDAAGQPVAMVPVPQTATNGKMLRVPRGSALISRSGRAIEVSGRRSVTLGANQRPAGVFIILQDITTERQEEMRLRQEHQMLVTGELARGVAHEFYALSSMIEDCSRAGVIERSGGDSELDLIYRASQIGKEMALQLMDLREANGPSHALNLEEYLLGAYSLLKRFCGRGVKADISVEPSAGYILSTGNHFEQMMMHLCLNARYFLRGSGKITLSVDVHEEPFTNHRSRSYLRLAFLCQRSLGLGRRDEEAALWPFEGQFPDVSLGLVRAMAVASEGFCRSEQASDESSLVEVFLPRFASKDLATDAAKEDSRILLLVGLTPELLESVGRAVGEDATLLQAANLEEASLISELYPSDFDLIVAHDSVTWEGKTRAYERIRARRPSAGFLQVGAPCDWPGATSVNPEELEKQVAEFFESPALRLGAGAT